MTTVPPFSSAGKHRSSSGKSRADVHAAIVIGCEMAPDPPIIDCRMSNIACRFQSKRDEHVNPTGTPRQAHHMITLLL